MSYTWQGGHVHKAKGYPSLYFFYTPLLPHIPLEYGEVCRALADIIPQTENEADHPGVYSPRLKVGKLHEAPMRAAMVFKLAPLLEAVAVDTDGFTDWTDREKWMHVAHVCLISPELAIA